MTPCVEAPGYRMPNGYARKWYRGRQQLAHRVAYQERFGEVPPGLVVMHTCDNPGCINTDHLVLGTQADNMTDKASKGRAHRLSEMQTHCKNGHEFTPSNTRLSKQRGYVVRVCRACVRDRANRRVHAHS